MVCPSTDDEYRCSKSLSLYNSPSEHTLSNRKVVVVVCSGFLRSMKDGLQGVTSEACNVPCILVCPSNLVLRSSERQRPNLSFVAKENPAIMSGNPGDDVLGKQ